MAGVRRRRVVGVFVAVAAAIAGLPSAAASTMSTPATAAIGRDLAPAARGTMVQLSHPAVGATAEVVVGSSVEGRPIIAYNRRGSLTTTRTVVAVGVIHGDERHGRLVTDRLLTASLPADIDLWIVPSMNPDGEVNGGHRNARGVDLNRNWPANWLTGTKYSSGRYFSGTGPASEPEVQAMMRFLSTVEPDVTVWFHSPWNTVDCDVARVGPSCQVYAAAVAQRVSFAARPGTATDWMMTEGLGVSFVMEFASSAPPSALVDRHVAAVLHLTL